MAEELLDSYAYTNYSSAWDLRAVYPADDGISAVGQCCTLKSATLTKAQFYIARYGSPVGNLRAVLTKLSGNYGTNASPTGESLAESVPVAMAGLSYDYTLVNFIFSTPYKIEAGYYGIYLYVHDATTINSSNCVKAGYDGTSPTHSGNEFDHAGGEWWSDNNKNVIFYVYGELPTPPANPLISKPLISLIIASKPIIR